MVQYLSQKKLVNVVCGYNHTLVQSLSGTVYGFGSNEQGQLGPI
jgi:alpha-tubulin suppressor-like RCC1 family protein